MGNRTQRPYLVTRALCNSHGHVLHMTIINGANYSRFFRTLCLARGTEFHTGGVESPCGFPLRPFHGPSVKIPFLCTDQPVGSHFNAVTEPFGRFPWSDPISHLPVCPCLLENTWLRPFSCLLVNPGFIPFCCVFDISGSAFCIPWVTPTPGVLFKVKISPCSC